VHEIHGLTPVAEYEGRLVSRDSPHPAYQNLRVLSVHVHPRTVHVEVSQNNIWKAIHVVKRAQQAFQHNFCGPVPSAIVIWMVMLAGWEAIRKAVSRSRLCCPDFLYPSGVSRL